MSTLSFADTKSTCYLAYEAVEGEKYRFSDGTIWKVLASPSSYASGFKAILIEPKHNYKNVTVLAFAGTDSIPDLLADLQQMVGSLPIVYGVARYYTQLYQKQYPNLHLTGHSLGGGMAAYASVLTMIPASTINPAPLIGAMTTKSFAANNQIVNYIAGGTEFVSSSPGRNPGRDIPVDSTGNFFGRHLVASLKPGISLPQRITMIDEAIATFNQRVAEASR